MRAATQGKRVDFLKLTAAMSSTKLSHYAFRNNGDLTYANQTAAWGLDTPSFANGAAYGDLDGDGAPDLVVNNVDQEAFVYRNNARTLSQNRYLQVQLEAEGANRFAVGAKVTLWSGKEQFFQEEESTRGVQSTVDYVRALGDGLDDMFIGGAKDQPGELLIQQPDGRFVSSDPTVFEQDRVSEDLGAVFFDADGDGHPDLYVVSGGNEFSNMSPALQDRLYLNDGRGHFRKAIGNLPTEYISGSRVVAADCDGGGDLDLFVGGRVVPWRYGVDPQSMLLQ